MNIGIGFGFASSSGCTSLHRNILLAIVWNKGSNFLRRDSVPGVSLLTVLRPHTQTVPHCLGPGLFSGWVDLELRSNLKRQ